MKYIGEFRSVDNILYGVEIITNNDESEETPIVLAGEEPVIIEQDSDGLFTPIKGKACTIKLVSKEYYFDMYTSIPQGTLVKVINKTSGKIEFRGYLTPNIYSQEYRYLNEVELEAVEAISTLKYFKWKRPDFIETDNASFYQILKYLLHTLCGYNYIWVNTDLAISESVIGLDTNLLFNLYIDLLNFYEDDGVYEIDENGIFYEAESLNCDEVLEEICKFLNCSCIIDKDEVYLLNYHSIKTEDRAMMKLDFSSDSVPLSRFVSSVYAITEESYKDEGAEISLTPSYNKINVECNEYPQTSVIPDFFDSKVYSPMEVLDRTSYKYQFLTSPIITNFLFSSSHQLIGYDTENILRMIQYNEYETHDDKKNGSFCMRYVYYSEESEDEQVYKKPEVKYMIGLTGYGEDYVCKINTPTYILQPNEDTTYIVLNSDIFFSTKLFNEEEPVDIYYPLAQPWYKDAIPVFKAKVLVENENGNNKIWVNHYIDGFIGDESSIQEADRERRGWEVYDPEDDEQFCYISANSPGVKRFRTKTDYSIGGNFTLHDNVLADAGYAIPVSPSDSLNGTLKIYLKRNLDYEFTPRYEGQIRPLYTWIKSFSYSLFNNLGELLADFPDDENANETDTTYYNVPEETYVEELDSIELKINTQVSEKTPSYSSVMIEDDNGYLKYLSELYSNSLGKSQKQEYNIIEQQYAHYGTPKISITLSIPYHIENSQTLSAYMYYLYPSLANTRIFFMDTTVIDLKANKQEVNLIEF